MTFGELKIPAALVAALTKQGIADPMPIQVEAMPVLLAGKHAYVNSETGTGKTLTEQESRLVRRYQSELGITLTHIFVREGRVMRAGPLGTASLGRRGRHAKGRSASGGNLPVSRVKGSSTAS